MIDVPFAAPPADRKGPFLFVAYEKEPRHIGDGATGEAIDLRPSVFVREYPHIKVAGLQAKQRGTGDDAFEFAYVTFDAASVGPDMSQDFGAAFKRDDELFSFLQTAMQQGRPLWVAIETVRRPKGKSEGVLIPADACIQDLRGVKQGGRKADMGLSGENCKNVLIAAGYANEPGSVRFTQELRSDPQEWGQLRRNGDNSLPPTGWRILRGGIVASSGGTAGAPAVDVDAIAAAVVQRLASTPSHAPAPALAPHAADSNGPAPRPVQREGYAAEGRPWDQWNSDGRGNLGSYLSQKFRASFQQAIELLADDVSLSASERVKRATELSEYLMGMADVVQSQAYGGSRPDRCARSHAEAARWIRYAYSELAIMPGFDQLACSSETFADETLRAEWTQQVISCAGYLMGHEGAHMEAYLSGTIPAFTMPSVSAPSATSTTPAPPSQVASTAVAAQPPAAPTPAPGASVSGAGANRGPVAAADVPELTARYHDLLTDCGLLEHPQRFGPLFEETFGSKDLAAITADAFAAALTRWESNPQAWVNDAFAAWSRVAQHQPVNA